MKVAVLIVQEYRVPYYSSRSPVQLYNWFTLRPLGLPRKLKDSILQQCCSGVEFHCSGVSTLYSERMTFKLEKCDVENNLNNICNRTIKVRKRWRGAGRRRDSDSWGSSRTVCPAWSCNRKMLANGIQRPVGHRQKRFHERDQFLARGLNNRAENHISLRASLHNRPY